MAKKISVPRGTTDILPAEISTWQNIEQITRKLLGIYNYKEIRTPIYEETDLFQRSLGQTSDVVNKQLLQLAGDKKEGFSLRPEGTASVVRSYIEQGLDRKEALSKLYYIGPMFRGERPQKGRLRQFHQIGVEAIGVDSCSPYLDAEIISLSVKLLHLIGLEGFELKINSLGTVEDKNNFSSILKDNLNDKRKDLCSDCQDRYDRNVFRILDCKNETCRDIVHDLKIGNDYLSDDSKEYFNRVKDGLVDLDVSFEVDEKLVRGLDYYTHTVFEISDSNLGSQDALGAGGRYSNLVKQLGGPNADAVGFALGIERMILALNNPAEDTKTLEVFIIALDEKSFKIAVQLADALRKEDIQTDVSYRSTSLKAQMKFANKINARSVVIIGEEELKENVVTFKDMESSDQLSLKIDNNEFSSVIKQIKERE